MKPIKLKIVNAAGAGMQIHGKMPQTTNCAEFELKADFQMIASEPWIQFKPKEWSDMIATTFQEMVDLWNEKNSKSEKDS